ncbi:hypothetical protein BDQ12DRAFT_726157 [Crucibulum laeve]|uniref:Uncharacterized protein n=1 Tax=Crucibulum laeve TaxID=68775 RepID=A0A5C3LR46_9AGAR|nr:hypothetical protein BDQ12DRAFT_726157 [Crucibulum laeve]
MTAKIEEAISVIACNLPVLISWGYHSFSSGDEDASGDHITPHWSQVVPGGLSMPTFVLTDLSGGHNQISDNVVQLSASEASLPSQMGAHRDKNLNNEWKATENVPDSIPRKDVII